MQIFSEISGLSCIDQVDFTGVKESRGQGFEWSATEQADKNVKELQRVKSQSKAYELCLEIYRITAIFPREERCGLNLQIRRSALSIPSDVAEGYDKLTTFD